MVGDIFQPTHLLLILVVALFVLGPKRLPEVGRTLGSGIRDFRSALSGDSSSDRDRIESDLADRHGQSSTTVAEHEPFSEPAHVADEHAADHSEPAYDEPAVTAATLSEPEPAPAAPVRHAGPVVAGPPPAGAESAQRITDA